MWSAYQASRGGGSAAAVPASAWHFCDNEQDANECARLVLSRKKVATATSLWFFQTRGEAVPQPGDLHVVTNWAGEAQCVIRTTGIEIIPFDQVSEEHAQAEGEGDLTLPWWRRTHWEYYHRELQGRAASRSSTCP